LSPINYNYNFSFSRSSSRSIVNYEYRLQHDYNPASLKIAELKSDISSSEITRSKNLQFQEEKKELRKNKMEDKKFRGNKKKKIKSETVKENGERKDEKDEEKIIKEKKKEERKENLRKQKEEEITIKKNEKSEKEKNEKYKMLEAISEENLYRVDNNNSFEKSMNVHQSKFLLYKYIFFIFLLHYVENSFLQTLKIFKL
jgi:hypothetical protein